MSLPYRTVHTPTMVSLAALLAATMAAPAIAQTGSAAASSADGLSAVFTVGDLSTGLGPVAPVEGSAPPAYNKTVHLATFNKIVTIIPSRSPVVALYTDATGIKSHAASGGIGIDFVSAEGDASLKSAALAINLNPPPPGQTGEPTPQPYLEVIGKAITSMATLSQTFPQPPTVSGTTSFGTLTVSGSLLGSTVLHFSGPAAPDTVLYQSDTVTIILNHQAVPVVLSCAPSPGTCSATPTSITTDAVDILLNGADIRGAPVSGELTVARSAAQ